MNTVVDIDQEKEAAASAKPLRVAVFDSIPFPYRLPVFARMATEPGIDLDVIFCSEREPDREWKLNLSGFKHHVLGKSFVAVNGRFIHNNLGVFSLLKKLAPDVVVTTGFNPTFLYAFAWARLNNRAHVAKTDGTFDSETKLTRLHRLVRRWVYAGSQAYVGASRGSAKLYRSYGIADSDFFQSHLCIDNQRFQLDGVAKEYDLLFSGRFVAGKRPEFALQVAQRSAALLGRRVRLVMLGSGKLRQALEQQAAALENVEVLFPGFLQQDALPELFNRCRLLVFPTADDVWGVVANEACAAGLPVVISPHAGAAGEIVVDGVNGYVRALDVERWAQAVCDVLSDPVRYQAFSQTSRAMVAGYTYDAAAEGLLAACRSAARIHAKAGRAHGTY